jgi:phosphatidylethanolamine-binding protein (PEBP) family uncharacterized protein
LVGTADGTTLYVADHGAGLTFSYTIERDGTLSNKKLFAPIGSDGMDLDAARNLYLTTSKAIQAYDASGAKLGSISLPEDPTNLAFAGADGKTLFVTARTAVYTIPFSAAGSEPSGSAPAVNVFATPPTGTFTLTSPDLPSDGRLPAEYTCDGSASTLALNWSSAPLGTTAYAVIMHHTPEQEESHWYWVLYNIPADVTSLSKNSSNIGNLGTNSVNGRLEYAPPCSKGPGDKEYFYTLYALSSQPQLDVSSEKVDRAALLRAMESITLARAELKVVYARP